MKFNSHQQRVIAFFLLIAIVNSLTGCKYYKPVAAVAYNDQSKHSSLRELNEEGKYFILRKGAYSYSLNNVVLDDTKMTLTAKADTIPAEHKFYIKSKKKKYSYNKSNIEVLREVHIYTVDTSHVDTSLVYTFPLSDVKKIEIIEYDKKRSNASTAKAIVITAVATALIVLAITAGSAEPPPPQTTTGSCPYISTFDGKDYNLQGEIYSASIYQTLQKDDYLPLQLGSAMGDYKIRISNELQEIQYTDFADLIVVEHDKNVQMLVNPNGDFFSISNPEAPEAATLNNNIDVRNELLNKDNYNCYFKDDHGARAAEDLYISFKNDSKSNRGKLILSGKTSGWVNYLFGEFAKGFGSYYAKWASQQEKRPASELEKWTNEQNIPLTVSVKTKEGWKEIQKLKVVGPLLNRDMVIPVDLPDNGPAEFKISCGYLFWELDYAAIDYTPDVAFTANTVKPFEATDEKGLNVLPAIANPDKQYLVQPDIGNTAIIKYNRIEPKEGRTQTFFLHSSGYYTHIRHYNGSPKTAYLKSFEQPGAFSVFSRQKFTEGLSSTASK